MSCIVFHGNYPIPLVSVFFFRDHSYVYVSICYESPSKYCPSCTHTSFTVLAAFWSGPGCSLSWVFGFFMAASVSGIQSKGFPSGSFWTWGRARSHKAPDPVRNVDEDTASCFYLTETAVSVSNQFRLLRQPRKRTRRTASETARIKGKRAEEGGSPRDSWQCVLLSWFYFIWNFNI